MSEECRVVKFQGEIVAVYTVRTRHDVIFKFVAGEALTEDAMEYVKREFEELREKGLIESYTVNSTIIEVKGVEEGYVGRLGSIVRAAVEMVKYNVQTP